MVKEYSSKDIRVLDDITTVRINTSMYIGTTETPTHLIEEAFDNSVDEALGGSATIVAIILDTKNNSCSVLDNGRGIPISDDVPIKISTKLHSGAKFQDKKTAYEIVTGLHGIGLVAVNALSEWFNIEIYRKGKHAIFNFQNAKLKSKEIKDFTGKAPFSTKVEFKPDKTIFESLVPDIDRLRKRLTVASAELKDNYTFVLQIDDKKEVFKLSTEELFKNECEKDELTKVIKFTSEKKPENFNTLIAYSLNGSTAPKVITSVNLLPVSGGTHVNVFLEMLKDFFTEKAKKFGYKFQPSDCFTGLRSYLTLNLIDPKYSSQTKEKLANRKSDLDDLIKQLKNKINQYYMVNENELKEHLERFQLYRTRLDSKKVKINGNSRRASTQFTKLRDCRSRTGTLFLVEGDSAGGSILQCRDVNMHAVFPLRGKIPNAVTKKDILKHNEISELIYNLGTGVEPDVKLDSLRYGKVVIAADADPDGGHIASLATMVFAILIPDIIKSGKLYIAQTPLFAINEKNIFIPLWTNSDLEIARKENRTITRFKGLGELSPKQIKICLLNDDTKRHIQVQYTSDLNKMIKLFSTSEEKRKLMEIIDD